MQPARQWAGHSGVSRFPGSRNQALWFDRGGPLPGRRHRGNPVFPAAPAVPDPQVLCLLPPRGPAEVSSQTQVGWAGWASDFQPRGGLGLLSERTWLLSYFPQPATHGGRLASSREWGHGGSKAGTLQQEGVAEQRGLVMATAGVQCPRRRGDHASQPLTHPAVSPPAPGVPRPSW